MGRTLTGSGSLTNASAPVTAVACTVACWFRAVDVTAVHSLVTLDDGSTNNRMAVQANGAAAGDPIQAVSVAAGAAATAATSTSYTANAWHHACGVFATTTNRIAYLNGGGKNNNSTGNVPSGINATRLGINASAANGLSGDIAYPAIWNVALTDAEVLALAKGTNPLTVRATNLVFFAPLWGSGSPEPDYTRGARHLTLASTNAGPNPPVQAYGLGMGLPSTQTAGTPDITTLGLVFGGAIAQRELKIAIGGTLH